MHFERSTAAFGAERRSTVSNVSRTYRTMAALVVGCLATFGTQLRAENLLLKNSDGTTITQIPLTTSQGCAVVGGGDIEVRPQPTSGTAGDGWCPQGVAPSVPTFQPTSGGQALAVSPLSIIQGGSVSATWTSISNVAQTCTGSATVATIGASVTGWTGTRATSQLTPGLSFTLTDLGAHVFMITCTNSAGSTTSTALTVNVIPPTNCPGSILPSYGLVAQTSMTNTVSLQGNTEHPPFPPATTAIATITSFNFLSGPWPQRSGNGSIAIRPGNYVALAFDTGTMNSATYGGTVSNPNRFGSLQTFTAASNIGTVQYAISECPGDFLNLPENNSLYCRVDGSEPRLTWGVATTNGFVCRLLENRRYYLNIAFVTPINGTPSCTSPEATTGSNPGSCHWFVLLDF